MRDCAAERWAYNAERLFKGRDYKVRLSYVNKRKDDQVDRYPGNGGRDGESTQRS